MSWTVCIESLADLEKRLNSSDMVSRLLTLFFMFEFHEYVAKFDYKFLILRRKNRRPVPMN